MKTLADLIGEEIIISIPFMHRIDLQLVKLHAIEPGGIWIENEPYTQTIAKALQVPALKTPLLFVPFSQIQYVMGVAEGISLSEKAFGVSHP